MTNYNIVCKMKWIKRYENEMGWKLISFLGINWLASARNIVKAHAKRNQGYPTQWITSRHGRQECETNWCANGRVDSTPQHLHRRHNHRQPHNHPRFDTAAIYCQRRPTKQNAGLTRNKPNGKSDTASNYGLEKAVEKTTNFYSWVCNIFFFCLILWNIC